MLALIFVVLACTICYFFLKSNYEYWKKRGINGPKPTFLVGNLGRAFLLQTSPGEIYTEIYRKFPDEELVGVYRGTTPCIVARDPDFIKEVTVKSFEHFQDNDMHISKKHDPIFGRNPFVLKGEEWKRKRAQLTSAFTTQKMKWLYPLLEDVSLKLAPFVETQSDAFNGKGYEVKELCTRFTLNNVATCAFGLEGKCFEEDNSSFRQLAKEFFSPGSWAIISLFLMTILPSIAKILPIRLVTKKVEKKLVDMITRTLKFRDDNNVVRNDFLHIMNQLKNSSSEYEFTDLDVTAHAAEFFSDGFETSSIVMSFTLFELASNPQCQNILREEIMTAFGGNEKVSYEVLQNLPYLESVINEALRYHPTVFLLQKSCTKTFIYNSEKTQKSVTIEKGTPIILPVYGLQHDPKYFEEPEVFKPERFLSPNKESVTKYTYLPFGEGPRACLGSRFGLLQVKNGIAHIIKHYELSVNKKTQLPIKYEVFNVMIYPVGGLWLDLKKIY